MSIAQNPLLGPMTNSMGNFTMYTYNGMNIVRSKAFKVKDAKSEKQLNVRARMAALGEKYRFFKSVIGLGFPEDSEYKSPQNMYVKANYSTAFELIDDKPVFSYPLMVVAKGSLPVVTVTESVIDAEGIKIQFDASALFPNVTAADELIASARLESGVLLIVRQVLGFKATGTIHLNYPNLQAGDVECCYLFVRSGDGKKTSNSVFMEVNS
ncbi:MAG: DUF6266 family protein [Paludibacter sp.]|nr:DUF6266 family protein [Paludibacter sp.]